MSDEIRERFVRRADAFETKVAAVRPEQWANASPCEKWTARDVVGHIVDMLGVMLRPLGREPSPAPDLQSDPLGAYRSARADVQGLLDDPAVAATQVDSPAGRMTVAAQIDQVVSDDLVLHGWDLARATGQDDAIDPHDLQRLWDGLQAIPADLLEQYRTPGAFGPGVEVFGPEVPVAADAPLQHRLLGMIGRDPLWRPA